MKNYLLDNKHYKTLNVLSFGHQVCSPLHSFSYAYTDFYLIHYIVKGRGTILKNKTPLKASEGEIFIIKPGSIYTYTADKNDPWEYIWISFEGETAKLFEEVNDVQKVNSAAFIDMLQADFLVNTRTEFLTGKLYEFISDLFESSNQNQNYVKTVSDYIKANYMHKLQVKDIASMLNLSSAYLSRIFRQEKNISIQDYILKYKIKKAQSLLLKGFNVNEAAKSVGYDDPFTFSKIFKKHTGISPSKFPEKKGSIISIGVTNQ